QDISRPCTPGCGRSRQLTSTHPAVAYDLCIKCPCMRQQSRGFFTAGLSINCACFLKQSCIADSLCAASNAAEDAKAMTRVAAVSNAFMADSFGERTCKTAVFGSPAARLATKI